MEAQPREKLQRAATDKGGNIWLTGGLVGKMAFQGGELDSGVVQDNRDMLIMKLGSEGNWIWGKQFGDAQNPQDFFGVKVDEEGNGVVVGSYVGSVELGENLFVHQNPSMRENRILAKFDDATGEVKWAKNFPCNGMCESSSKVFIDSVGQIVVAGKIKMMPS